MNGFNMIILLEWSLSLFTVILITNIINSTKASYSIDNLDDWERLELQQPCLYKLHVGSLSDQKQIFGQLAWKGYHRLSWRSCDQSAQGQGQQT